MEIFTAISLWLHDMATVLLIGHYLLLVLVYLPLLKSEFQSTQVQQFLQKITQRIQPWLGVALLIFLATGILLMLVNPNYLGVGNFGNQWSILMVLKHIMVIGMVALAFWIGMLTRPAMAQRTAAYNPHPPFIFHITNIIQLQAVLGVLVLLMTGFARM